MKTVILQNVDGERLAFMLCSVDLAEGAGDCTFVAVPGRAALLDHPEEKMLALRRSAGESSWEVTRREPLTVVITTPGWPDGMFIEIESTGPGRWGVGEGLDRLVLGQAIAASKD
ncbi:hypothetical protein P12x_000450 [Tundrisphaera lichenicola]|uniref:hypothetical protein n=1 Tax=Tundrisphaera lichenicola TaxID=2029860 RepID=UPI003EC09F45